MHRRCKYLLVFERDEKMSVFDPDRKRSARGKLRVQSLLDSAGRVFGDVGYHAATTNLIAAEGGVSPATLYQFFPNKDALADALATQYAEELMIQERGFDPVAIGKMPLDTAIAHITDIVIEFHCKHPAFLTLLTEAPLSQDTRQKKHQLSQTFNEKLAELLVTRNRSLSAKESLWHADVCLTVLKGFLPLLVRKKKGTRERFIESLNQVLVRYLTPAVEGKSRE